MKGWLIGGVIAAAAVGGGLALLYTTSNPSNRQIGGGCPAGDVAPNADGTCPDGYQADPNATGCCAPVPSGDCPGTSPCSSDADCPSGQDCIGGSCGSPIPSQLHILDIQALGQDETVAWLFGICDGGLSFVAGNTTATITIQITDSGGNPVPDLVLLPSFESGILFATPGVTTDTNGQAEIQYRFRAPWMSSCPPLPGIPATETAVDTLDIYLADNSLFGSIPVTADVYLIGV